MAATFPNHPGEHALVDLLRRWIQGDTQPWIYEANIYAEDPVSMTAKYLPATAEDGLQAWYFVCIPRKKDGNDARISRVTDPGTWKGERKFPMQAASRGGHHVRVGWKQTFSYTIKSKTEGVIRVGWILKCIMLNEGEDSQQRCLCKVYPSPYKDKKANPLVPQLAILAPAPLMDDAAAAAAAAATPTAPVAATTAATTGAATPTAAAATTTTATAATPTAAATPTPTPTPTAATAATPTAAAAAATPTAPTTTPTAAATSPPKKWVQVQISDSPTKSSDLPKRVYQMMDITAQEGVGDFSKKRMKMLKGWLTIDPVP